MSARWAPLLGLLATLPALASPIALVGGRIHTGRGAPIPRGTVLLRDGRIEAVGSDVPLPSDARVVDVTGAWITAGFFDAESRVGIEEVSLEPSTVETRVKRDDRVRAAFRVTDGLDPASVVIPVTRIEGITTVALAPTGGLVAGQGAVVDLDGTDVRAMRVRDPSAMYLRHGNAGKNAAHGSRGGLWLRLRELLDDVRDYARRRQDYDRRRMRSLVTSRLDLEALLPVALGKLPLVVRAHRAADIQAVLRFARRERLQVILAGADEGWLVAREIAAAGVPVIVDPLQNLPRSFESLRARLDNAALLHRAGVKIALSPRGEPHNSRTLKQAAGNAVAHGLPWDVALRAVTLHPAEIFGVADRYGTLEPGKVANVVVWSGDPFETSTRVRRVFIRGREIPLRSRQTELRERYRDLSGMRPRY